MKQLKKNDSEFDTFDVKSISKAILMHLSEII